MAASPLFWALALALVAATLAALLWPLLRRRQVTTRDGETAAAAVFRDHRRQIDADHAAGLISSGERETAMAELVARLGGELAQAEPDHPALHAGPPRAVGVALLIMLPVAAAVMYAVLGNPQAMNPSAARPATTPAQMLAMVEALHQRMKANPEDGNGWALLGRSYVTLGRFADAAQAFAQASERLSANAALLADQAEAIALTQGERLAGEPVALLERALALDAKHPKTLALLATAAIERDNYVAGIGYWRQLRDIVPEGSADRARIDEVLAELEARRDPAASARAAPTDATPRSKSIDSAVRGSAAPTGAASRPETLGSAAPAATTAGSRSVEGRVEIAPAFASNVGAGDTLFIFARDPDGSRMPLAAIKLTAGKWPQPFRLTDEMAMAPGAVLSNARQLIVEARVSRSGNATPASGDLSGKSVPVAPGARDVRVVLDRLVP